ncbi:MAG TPA: hypothetical protein DCZ69_08195 [Syntrophobacteraceae bacterium]|nr:hypothetical protein [Syntrophobacteraceae bacterium]
MTATIAAIGRVEGSIVCREPLMIWFGQWAPVFDEAKGEGVWDGGGAEGDSYSSGTWKSIR